MCGRPAFRMTRTRGDELRVLVVEDEVLVAMLIEDMLLENGCEGVEICGRMEAALARVTEGAFDFVILDLNLEGDLTYPVADLLIANKVPFVFATGYGNSMLTGPYSKIPSLQKPFQMADIERVMQEIIGPSQIKSSI